MYKKDLGEWLLFLSETLPPPQPPPDAPPLPLAPLLHPPHPVKPPPPPPPPLPPRVSGFLHEYLNIYVKDVIQEK